MPLTIVGACVIPLFYFFNSYFIGKIIKKIFPYYNSLITTSLGFFIFQTVVFIVSIPIFVSPVNFIGYGIILIIVQVFLFFIYCFNWKYSISFEIISWKKLCLIFFFSLFLFATWFLSNNIKHDNELIASQDYLSYESILYQYFSRNVTWNDLVFSPSIDPNIIQYSAWNSLNKLWIFVFQIQQDTLFSPYNSYFGVYSLLSIYSIITSLTIFGCFENYFSKHNYLKLIVIFFVVVALNTILFLFLNNSLNGISWLIPISILLLYLTFYSLKNKVGFQSDFFYTLVILSVYSMSQIFIFLIFAITFTKFLINIISREQHYLTSFIIYSLGPALILIFLILNIWYIATIILLIILIFIYIAWFACIRLVKFKIFIKKIELFLSNHIWTLIIFFILILYFVSIFLSFSGGIFHFQLNSWTFFIDKFSTLYSSYSENFVNNIFCWTINISFWCLNVILFLYCFYVIFVKNLVIFNKLNFFLLNKKKRFTFFVKEKSYCLNNDNKLLLINQENNLTNSTITNGKKKYLFEIDIEKNFYLLNSIILFLVVWNPLSTNIIDRINLGLNFNVSWLFFVILISFLLNDLSISKTYTKIFFVIFISTFSLFITTLIGIYNFI